MNIAGIQKFTLVDFPGKVAATIFTRGCTFQCGFCHNPELVLPKEYLPLMDENDILNFLSTRVGKLQGVCLTGGEPTMNSDLPEFIREIKKMGFAIKLDTNGSLPDPLEKLIATGDIDYIAMDIKSPLRKYEEVTNLKSQISNLKIKESIPKSIKMIMNSGIDYEFRTTIVKPLHQVEDFKEIGELIKGAKRYYLQNFVQSKHVLKDNNFESFGEKEIKKAKSIIKKFVCEAEIR